MIINKILLIDDDSNHLKEELTKLLSRNGYFVEHVCTAEKGFSLLKEKDFDCFIVNTKVKDKNVINICKNIREKTCAPIIIISDDDDEMIKVLSFNAGCDDFLITPIKTLEFLARVSRLIQKYKVNIIEINGVSLDKELNIVRVDGKKIYLTNSEYKVLRILMQHPQVIVSKETLGFEVWEWENVPDSTITTTINRLRNKIGKDKIQTARGQGYSFSS